MSRSKPSVRYFSKREQQILDVVYRLGEATAAEIVAGIPRPPSLDSVRRLIRILEEKGLLSHRKDGPRHVYSPTVHPDEARRSAWHHLLSTYFRGSATQAVAALIEAPTGGLSTQDLDEISALIARARAEGR